MSSYQEYTELPEFAFAKWDKEGKKLPGDMEKPAWSRQDPPPAIGEVVNIAINQIGLAKVMGYFVEGGYLGVLTKPIDPPDWFIRQKGYFATAHVFGAELRPGTFAEPELRGPSQEQLAALQNFATTNGRSWKRALLSAWGNGGCDRLAEGALLQQVRNQFGPTWLMSDKNPVVPKYKPAAPKSPSFGM